MTRYYSGVGSRETPKEILGVMEQIGFALAKKGFILRSGHAEGADMAFEMGAKKHVIRSLKQMYDIYIPWKGFNECEKSKNHFIATELDNYEAAWQMASETHPAWGRCSAGGQALHSRNCYQVLGHDLTTPSKFLICWSKPTSTGVSGGTNLAWTLAKKHGIPCFNLYNNVDLRRVSKLLT